MTSPKDDELLDLAKEIAIAEEKASRYADEARRLRALWQEKIALVRSASQSKQISIPSPDMRAMQAYVAERNEISVEEVSHPTLVYLFLSDQPDRDFSPEQIAEGIGRPDKVTSIRSTLQRMTGDRVERVGRGRYRLLRREILASQ